MFFKSKATTNEDSVRKILSTVMDPDLGRDIVSLGFVKKIEVHGDHVHVTVELTTPACPVKEQLKAECEQKIKSLEGIKEAHVEMTANVKPAAAAQGDRIAIPGVKHVIAVASGKGGVGKSTVAVNLAVALSKAGAKVGLMDADIYGPSLPMMMGVRSRPESEGNQVTPLEKDGIKLMSMGFLVPDNQAVIWRGPMVHGALTQFLTHVKWGELDYLVIDMPPGTGDAQLTISQSAPLTGAVIVTTPQDISLIDARRGMAMFKNVKVPLLGVVENMAGFVCGHCHEVTDIFKSGGGTKIAEEMGVPLLGSVPIDSSVAQSGDTGTPIVISNPNSPASQAFMKIAAKVAAEISIAQWKDKEGFKPLSLDWN